MQEMREMMLRMGRG
jgi:uncharacterized protein YpuA (DUF1002 family)